MVDRTCDRCRRRRRQSRSRPHERPVNGTRDRPHRKYAVNGTVRAPRAKRRTTSRSSRRWRKRAVDTSESIRDILGGTYKQIFENYVLDGLFDEIEEYAKRTPTSAVIDRDGPSYLSAEGGFIPVKVEGKTPDDDFWPDFEFDIQTHHRETTGIYPKPLIEIEVVAEATNAKSEVQRSHTFDGRATPEDIRVTLLDKIKDAFLAAYSTR